MARLGRVFLPVVLLATLVVALAAPGSAAADGPATGLWTGTAGATTVNFVVSQVGGTTVLSDVTLHCDDSFGAAGDDDPEHERHEAAIDAQGVIHEQAKPIGRNYADSLGGSYKHLHKGIAGHLGSEHGTVSVNGNFASGPEGGRSNTGSFCEDTEDMAVSHVPDAHLVEDGLYEVAGTGEEGTFWVYGRGSLIEWFGDFRTPIGGSPEVPELNCAESAIWSADITGWQWIYPSASGAFAGTGNGGIVGQATLAGQFIGSDKAAGTWSAFTSYPQTCSGAGVFALTLKEPLPELVPMTPLHSGSGEPGHQHEHEPSHGKRIVRYVALGDSYSSGEGVPPYDADTDTRRDRCHRSKHAYSRLLNLPGVRLERSFFACSGATTADVLEKRFNGEPPQINRPQLREARLVTISIGGNDALFSKVVKQCTRFSAVPCWRGRAARKIRQRIGSLGPRLVATYRKIREHAPRAKIIALGYPNLMPKAGQTCGKLSALFRAPAREFMRAAGGQLSRVIAAAARRAGVRYLDVRQEFADHEFCAPDEWVHFVVRGKAPKVVSAASFHPTADGQAAYARILQRALR